jgi:hypothetical protein
MAEGPHLVVQVARGSATELRLRAQSPRSVEAGETVVEALPADEAGVLDAPLVGEVILSVPSPETLDREADEVRRVINHAPSGNAPLVIIVEAAEELRDEELTAVLDAAAHTDRTVILRVIRDA